MLSQYKSGKIIPNTFQLFGTFNIVPPSELTLKDILTSQAGDTDLNLLPEVILKIISSNICLQHLPLYMPTLQSLTLDDSIIASLRELGTGLVNLKILRVNRCGLLSLDGLAGLKKLEELYAGHNKIKDLSPCLSLNGIVVLDLRRNCIESIESLSFLHLCTGLQHLTILDNTNITSNKDYHSTIIKILPNLLNIDGKDVSSLKGECIMKVSVDKICKESILTPRQRQRINGTNSPFVVSFPPRVIAIQHIAGSFNNPDFISSIAKVE